MEFIVALCPYTNTIRMEIRRVLYVLDRRCVPPAENYKTLSAVLIAIGLLPVITIPIFHIWLIVIGFPPVLIGCVVCLIGGLILRKTPKNIKVKDKYLKITPNKGNGEFLRFDDGGVELQGNGTGPTRMAFTEFIALYRTDNAYHLVCADRRLLVVPFKDFQIGLPKDFQIGLLIEFGQWLSQKTGKPVEYIK